MTYTYIPGSQPEFVRTSTAPGVNEGPGTQGYFEDHYDTITKREAPTDPQIIAAQEAALLDTTGLPTSGNMVIGTANMYYQTFYSPTIETDYWTELQAYFNPRPIAVSPDRIEDSDHRFSGDPTGPLGAILWWPDDIPIEDRPSPDAGWVWADDPDFADRGQRRCDIVSVVMQAVSSDDVPTDKSGGNPYRQTRIFAQPDGVTWAMSAGHEDASGWTVSSGIGTPTSKGTFISPSQTVTIDLTDTVDEYGRCVVWTVTPDPLNGDIPPTPVDPSGTGSGFPAAQLQYGWTITYAPTITWTFRAPAFYWVLESSRPPRLRHLNIAPDRRGENWRGTSLRRISSYQ